MPRWLPSRPRRGARAHARSTLAELVVAIFILGALAAAIPLMTQGKTRGTKPTTSASTTAGSGTIAAPSGATRSAAIDARRANYGAAETAISEYQAKHGSLACTLL